MLRQRERSISSPIRGLCSGPPTTSNQKIIPRLIAACRGSSAPSFDSLWLKRLEKMFEHRKLRAAIGLGLPELLQYRTMEQRDQGQCNSASIEL